MLDAPDARYDSPQPLSDLPMALTTDEPRDNKKPRVRHSEAQLAALNDLYDEDEHPALELRAALAQRLGMYVCRFACVLFFRIFSFSAASPHFPTLSPTKH